MAIKSTSTTVTRKYPVKAKFKCQYCGKENCTDLVFVSEAHATERGYASAGIEDQLAGIAHQKLNQRAAEVAQDLRSGSLAQVINESMSRFDMSPVICDSCGTSQLPKKIQDIVISKGCLGAIILWFLLTVISLLGINAMAGSVRSDTAFVIFGCSYCLLSILLVVGDLLYEKNFSKRANSDPAVMKKHYNAAYNDNIEIDLSKYGFGIIRVHGEINESVG